MGLTVTHGSKMRKKQTKRQDEMKKVYKTLTSVNFNEAEEHS